MPESTRPSPTALATDPPSRRAVALLVGTALAIALLACAAAAVLYAHGKADLDSALGYGVLPATQSLLHGGGLTICSSELAKTLGNPLCFHAARMPMAEWVMAAALNTVGGTLWKVILLKMTLLLVPLGVAIYLTARERRCDGIRQTAIPAALLLAPFFMMPFLMQVVRLDYEEAYSYGFVALAFALALHSDHIPRLKDRQSYGMAALAGGCVAGVYLAKSSMILLAVVFFLVYLRRLHKPGAKLLLLALSLSAPVGWALYQHHASGRYSLGTSLDGFNLHMGNSEHFLRDYPPVAGRTLDDTSSELNAGIHFRDEWDLNDYHRRAALRFVAQHKQAALEGCLRKLWTIFVAVKEVATYKDHGAMAAVITSGILLFRIMFWSALLLSLWGVVTGQAPLREPGILFLLMVVAVILPYALGFAYTRHIGVLMYPTAILWCRIAGEVPGGVFLHRTHAGRDAS